MSESESRSEFLRGLREGDEAACREVVRRYAERLASVARRRAGSILGRKEDPEDVLQSAFKSFFARCREGEFDCSSWEEVWALLAVITVRKAANHRKHYECGKRDAGLERTVSNDFDPLRDLAGREPSPEEAAILVELLDRLTSSYGEIDRPAVELMLQGQSVMDVSARLGRAERTLRRLRANIEERLLSLLNRPDKSGTTRTS